MRELFKGPGPVLAPDQGEEMDGTKDQTRTLVKAAQNGNVSAFGRLISAHQDQALSCAFSLLRDYGRAQDVVQESFLAAYLGLGSLKDTKAFAAWLRGIVRHQCLRILRRADLEWVPLDGQIGIVSGAAAPDEDAERREMGSLAQQAMA